MDNFSIKDEKVKEFYDTNKMLINIEVELYTVYNFSISYGMKSYEDVSNSTYYKDDIKLRINIRDLILRYYFYNKSFITPYLGIGMNFYKISEIVDSSKLDNTEENANGLKLCVGSYVQYKNFDNIVFYIQIMYNSIKSDINDESFDFGGFEYLVGLKFRI